MSANSLLNIGISGLSTSKKGLSTASHNIANANTEGYSRQKTHQQSGTPINHGDLILGTGSRVKSVKRVHDQFLEKKVIKSTTEHNHHKERTFQLSQLEQVFNEVDVNGFSSVLNKFFNSFRELSKSPDDETIRSIVRDTATHVVHDIRKTKVALNELEENISKRLDGAVEDINMLTTQLGEINMKIRSIENGAGETGDLRDQRDLIVKNLSEFFELSTFEDNKGNFNVHVEGMGTLVSGNIAQKIISRRDPESGSHNQSGTELFFESRPNFNISNKLGKGKISAMLTARDNDLKAIQDKVDDLAFDLAHSVNAIHKRGYVDKGGPVQKDEQGRTIANAQNTGIDFFAAPEDRYRAAENLELSDLIKSDLRNIATALAPNSPGDNRVSIAIAKLQYEKVLDNDSATFEENYLKSLGKVGIESKKARMNEDQSMGILAQHNAMRERVSGVSIDEETSDMMKFQHIYDASARVMSVAEEMFDTVLNIKRL